MERFLTKKEKSEAEGQKRQMLKVEKAKKSSKFFMSFFEKPATTLLESQGGSSVNEKEEVIEQHDIGLLKFHKDTGKAILTETLIKEIIKLGSSYFQNSEGPFLPTNNCSMNETWFKRKMINGEEVPRSWLVYSPSKKSAFCFCCLLYSQSDNQSSFEQESGFNEWKAPERISVHESTKNHRECFIKWKIMARNLAEKPVVVDMALEKEKQKWRDTLMRILDCIKFLTTKNLALLGHIGSHQVDNDSNVGDFLGLLRLLASFDAVMKEHLTHVESHLGSISYHSPDVLNEFIHMMASTVRQRLLKRIRDSKYYGLILHSTPDQAHCDQMSEVVRYVEFDFERDKPKVCVKESFLGFIAISQKDADSVFEDILKQLEEDEMEIQDCRSLSYDFGNMMSGHISGAYQRINEKNNLAVFMDCNNYLLSLVAVHVAEQNTMMVTFLGNIEAFYVFFSSSTLRWEKLKNTMPVALKLESETRWSARTEAVEFVNAYFEEILQVLQDIEDDENETSVTRNDARQLYSCMLSFDFRILLVFWQKVLLYVDRVQKWLDEPSINFHNAALHLKTLRDYFYEEREVLVHGSLEEGLGLCQRHHRRNKQKAHENSKDAGVTANEEMKRVMEGTLDCLHKEMDERFIRLHEADTTFGFLLDVEGLCYCTDRDDLKNKCKHFGQLYSSDVNGEDLYEEIDNCEMFVRRRKILKPEEFLECIVEYGEKSIFPWLCAAMPIMLSVAVSITSRSFSKLKLILSNLKASVSQGSLRDLVLLCVEREETEKTDFDHIINHFATMEAQMVHL